MRDRLIELFKKIEYTPFPEMTMKSNLGNQFTDYALNCIVDEFLANGIIVPPCKVGDKVYVGRKQQEMTVKWLDCRYGCTVEGEDYKNFRFYFDLEDIGETVFLSREDAERALKERN